MTAFILRLDTLHCADSDHQINVVSVAVAFVPEGLPICVTLSLAKIASSLSKEKVLCKTLATVETLGSINTLCSDKTGTLTQNVMTVISCYLFGEEFTPIQGRDLLVTRHAKAAGIRTLQILSSVCNGAKFTAIEQSDDPMAPRRIQGDATDTAILRFSDFIASADVAREAFTTVYTQAFSSATKFMVTIVTPSVTASKEERDAMPCAEGEFIMMVKGAPDVLLRRCTTVYDPASDSPYPLDVENLAKIVAMQEKWASKGQRVLLVARRTIARTSDAPTSPAFAEYISRNTTGLEVVGLVGIIDPPREDIPETIRICRSAGIRVFMVGCSVCSAPDLC